LLGWFAKSARDLPWRHTLDPYAIWISEIMLQQTQVKTVTAYWERWMRALPDITALADAPPDKILKLWEGLGYYTRARNVQKAAMRLVSEHAGEFPALFDDVLSLPGIGRYTAGAICSIAFNAPAPIVDGNIVRVLTRVFGLKGDPRAKKTNAQLWSLAQSLVETAAISLCSMQRLACLPFPLSGRCSALNQALMELGALVCTPKQPRCTECPLRSLCAAFRRNLVDQLPNIGKRAQFTSRRFIAFVVEHRGRWLVRQRPAGGVNANLWELPNIEVHRARVETAALFAEQIGGRVRSMNPCPLIKHSITRHRISLQPFHVMLAARSGTPPGNARWLTSREVDKLAFPSAHRKMWNLVRALK
jgi:A/G-specific adenine glycosylase